VISFDNTIRRKGSSGSQCVHSTHKGCLTVVALPKCRKHNMAIELVRVEISGDEIVTEVFRCRYPECKTEHYRQQARRKTSLESSR
jgi:hypothetical protein